MMYVRWSSVRQDTYLHIYDIIKSLFWPSHILCIKSSVWPEGEFRVEKSSACVLRRSLYNISVINYGVINMAGVLKVYFHAVAIV